MATAALARRHRDAGRRVRAFKCGPDFLDPMILERASGTPVLQFDLCMGGGKEADMLGLLPGHVIMQPGLAALGLQAIPLPNGVLRGHTFYYSRLETDLVSSSTATNANGGAKEWLNRVGSSTASYMHFYFPSNPEATAALFH